LTPEGLCVVSLLDYSFHGMEELDLDEIRCRLGVNILRMFYEAKAGHIGSCFSCLEIMISIFFDQKLKKKDRFILSKGHAACALYNLLAESGDLNPELLKTFYKDGTSLAAHPPCQPDSPSRIPAIPFGTGSLGHGLSLSAGMLLASRLKGRNDSRYFCLISDGECNEGSVWEAALFASHHKMTNLWVIIDVNGLQGFGRTSEVLRMNLDSQWKSFGFETAIVQDGNNFTNLHSAFEALKLSTSDKPKCIIALTTKGNGVSYMENKLEWHYLPMQAEQYELALAETKAKFLKTLEEVHEN